MEIQQIGKTGKAHGTKGEIKLFVDDVYWEDLAAADALLIGEPPIPYFIEGLRGGGSLFLKLEDIDQRETVALLSNKPVYLPAEAVTGEPEPDDHPYLHLIDWHIEADGYGRIGPIVDVLDLPEHYLAQLDVDGREVFVPLHGDLIVTERPTDRVIEMRLPEGLLG